MKFNNALYVTYTPIGGNSSLLKFPFLEYVQHLIKHKTLLC